MKEVRATAAHAPLGHARTKATLPCTPSSPPVPTNARSNTAIQFELTSTFPVTPPPRA